MRFFIPALRARRPSRHDGHDWQLPPGAEDRNIASVEVRASTRIGCLQGKNVTKELSVPMHCGCHRQRERGYRESRASSKHGALAFEAGEAVLAPAERVDRGERAGARQFIEERAEVLNAWRSETLARADACRRMALGSPRLASAVGGRPTGRTDALAPRRDAPGLRLRVPLDGHRDPLRPHRLARPCESGASSRCHEGSSRSLIGGSSLRRSPRSGTGSTALDGTTFDGGASLRLRRRRHLRVVDIGHCRTRRVVVLSATGATPVAACIAAGVARRRLALVPRLESARPHRAVAHGE